MWENSISTIQMFLDRNFNGLLAMDFTFERFLSHLLFALMRDSSGRRNGQPYQAQWCTLHCSVDDD